MGRYSATQQAIFSIFGLNTWTAENIKTFPQDVVASNAGDEFVKVTIIPSGKGINRVSISGIVIIDIYTASGLGPSRASAIADKLDDYLCNKTVIISASRNVQFDRSTMVPKGIDSDNKTLVRSQYTIPFNLFGVN